MNRYLRLLVAGLLFTQALFAQDGSLDPTYGINGIVKSDFGIATPLSTKLVQGLVDADGSIYLVLKFQEKAVIQKLKPDGTPDLSYGSSGYSVTVEDIYAQAAFLHDGNIFIGGGSVGYESTDIVITSIKSDGTFDSSFAGSGRRVYPFSHAFYVGASEIAAIDVQSDKKIIIAGADNVYGFFVIRLNPDGSTDTSFKSSLPSTEEAGFPIMAKVTKAGKILIGTAGNGWTTKFLARLNSDGSLDSTFSDDGFVDSPYLRPISSYALDNDGNILAGANDGIYRFTSDGVIDNSFGNGGYVQTTIIPQALFYTLSGEIFLAGVQNDDLVVQKFQQDGMPDYSFSGDGQALFDLGQGEAAANLSAAQNGNILLFGHGTVPTGSGPISAFEVVQFKAGDGTADMSFSDDGILKDVYSVRGATQLYASVIQPNHKIISVGTTWNGTDNDFVVARYLQDGTSDDAFGTNGHTILDLSPGNDLATGVALLSDGKILVAGIAAGKVALSKFNANGSPDLSFNNSGYRIYDLQVPDYFFLPLH